ncbi:MAG: hypothetical protein PUA93_00245 [Eubacteriales bacterium]|nr:hypothetical protein [Eubacteriales bacterium]
MFNKKKKQEAVIPEVEAQSGLGFRSDADVAINAKALNRGNENEDEATLSDAMGQNPFKLGLLRNFIKLKNHIAIVPLISAIVTLVILNFTIFIHVNALMALRNDPFNAFKFFVNVIDSLLIVMCYLRVYSRKATKKQKIIFSVLFYVLIALSFYLDIDYLTDIHVELNLANTKNRIVDDAKNNYIANSYHWFYVHVIFLGITTVLAALEPVLQPFTKKIHIRIKKASTKEEAK